MTQQIPVLVPPMNPIFPPPPQYNTANAGEGMLEVDLQAKFWHQPQLVSHFRSADTGAYSPPVRGRVILHVPSTILRRLVVLILLSAIFGIVPLTALVWEIVNSVGSGLLDTFLVLYYLIAGFN